jgi:hypothetical protein
MSFRPFQPFRGFGGGAFAALDPDAAAYIAAVEAADTQPLETGIKAAIDSLFVGLKTDSEWSAITELRIYAGPRTLAGCAVPAKGAAPTLVNFVSSDINRKTGLIAASGKYVNHNNSALTQNSTQIWVWATELDNKASPAAHVFGNSITTSGGSTLRANTSSTTGRLNGTSTVAATSFPVVGLVGLNRNNPSNFVYRSGGASETLAQASASPIAASIYTFGVNNGGSLARGMFNRHAIEAIGTSWTDPANIEARIDTYMAAIAAAIP